MDTNLMRLIRRLQEGELGVEEEFCRVIYPKIYAMAMQIVKSDADAKDVAQESMLIIYKKISQLNRIESFYGWAKTIVFSRAYALFHKEKPLLLSPEFLSTFMKEEQRVYMNPKQQMELKNQQEILQEILSKLTKKHATVIELVYIQQKSLEEVSQLLNIPLGTVKSRIAYAKKELLHIIQNYEKEHDFTFVFRVNTVFASIASFPLLKKLKEKIQLQKCFHVGVCTAISISCYALVNESNLFSKERTYEQIPFPTLYYKGREISSYQAAYFTCLEFSHASTTTNTITQEEMNEMIPIVEALHLEANPFQEELEKRGWTSWFQQLFT